MEFKKYQHLERFNTPEVEGIDQGEIYIFPKIDGTNSSVWMDDGKIKAGSRNRELTLDKDNAGFYEWVLQQINISRLLNAHPNLRLYGEWLVPHSLKTYRDSAWRNFYVFDVIDGDSDKHMHYDTYKVLMDLYSIEYIPPLMIMRNPTEERILNQLKNNKYLIKDGKGEGEGIVIKNYEFVNQHGRQTWAKIVTSEFKEKSHKIMGAPIVEYKESIEQLIVNKYVTKALCEKVFSKINNEDGWTSRQIPRLFNTVFYDLVREESWNFIKEHKNPKIDFKKLNQLTIGKVKIHLEHLF
jgi:hypothetical protein